MEFRIFLKISLLFAVLSLMAVSNSSAPVFDGNDEVTLLKCWNFPVEDGKALAIGGANIFVGSRDGNVESISLDGLRLWRSELGGELSSNLLATDDGVFLVTAVVDASPDRVRGGILRLLSKETGITSWSAKLSEAENYSLGNGRDAVIVVTSRGVIESFDARTGARRWRRELADEFVAEPRFNHTNVYVASKAKQVFTVSLDSGEIISAKKLPFLPTAVGEITGNVITGDERGNVASYGKSDKRNWNFKSGGKISAIVEIGSNFLTASDDNFVYLFTARSGDVAWKRRLKDRISQIGVIEGKFVLVGNFDEQGVLLIELGSGKVVGRINLLDNEFAIAKPVSGYGKVFVLTNSAVYGYSTTTCS